MSERGGGLSAEELLFLGLVDGEIAKGLKIAHWWEREGSHGSERFDLIAREPGRGGALGVFQQASIPGLGSVPLTGIVQEIPFTRPKASPGNQEKAAQWITQQIREFALRYFLRVTVLAQAQTYPQLGQTPLPDYLQVFSMCPPQGIQQAGVEIRQFYYKRRDGTVGKFSEMKRSEIVDLRKIGPEYDWVLLRAKLFSASLNLTFSGPGSAQLVVPLERNVYLALCPQLIANQASSTSGLLGNSVLDLFTLLRTHTHPTASCQPSRPFPSRSQRMVR